MRKRTPIIALAFVLLAGVAAAPALLADDSHSSPGSRTERGMTGRDGMMMGPGGMMGMMGMMQQMSQMMDHCATMMGTAGGDGRRPNDQWRQQR